MRTLALSGAFPIAALTLLAGCNQLDRVDVTRSTTATVPAGPGAIPPSLPAALSVELGDQTLRDAGIDPHDVDSARARLLRLEVRQGASLESWLDRIAFYAEGGGRERTLVAERVGIASLPAGTTSLDLDVTGVDLKPFASASDGKLTVEATGTLPAVETVVEVTVTVRVDVNVAGVLGL
jgi:hypothetical protein